MMEKHNIEPVFDKSSKILILGSFPSVKSRETEFFYGHPQNRFWRTMANVLECDVPKSVDEKRDMLIKHNIALWDVIKTCEITGSADSSIKDVKVNDFSRIFSAADIKCIFANGAAAYNIYIKYVDKNIIKLPSTSPANAMWNVERLTKEWGIIRKYLK